MLLAVMLFAGIFLAAAKPTPAQADENFWVDLAADYQVMANGQTQVTHNFVITNRTPTYFINRYSLLVSSAKLTGVQVKVGEQILVPKLTVGDRQTNIAFDFPDKSVGEGKELRFSISYNNPELAQVSGKVLEIAVPPLARSENFRNYAVTVKTPVKFGPPARSQPAAAQISTKDGYTISGFDQTATRGITAVYGNEQFFKLNLTYPMDNPGSQPIQTQITFPPDTAFQKVFYENISPHPDSWKVDADGNWLATYILPANAVWTVTADAVVRTSLVADPVFPESFVLPSYTQPQEFWQTGAASITQAAKKLTTAADIYNFTIDTLTYTTQLSIDLKRLGAVEALKQPLLATCQEYADLFVALARAKNIPARRLIGYAQTQNTALRPVGLSELGFAGDVLHAWPEFYDQAKKQWRAIDPTWGDTTGGVDYFNLLDLNHIVFAINGSSDTLPYPVGSYEKGDEPTKTIAVSFTDVLPTAEPQLSIELNPKKIGPLVIPGWYDLVLINSSGSAWYNVLVQGPDEVTLIPETEIPNRLLPYQTFTTPISAYNKAQPNWFSLQPIKLNLLLGPKNIAATDLATFYAIPTQLSNLGFTYACLALGIGVVLIALIAGSLFLLGQKWVDSLRRQSQEPQEPTL
jgi:transglutaminase-like putative cysteine protease